MLDVAATCGALLPRFGAALPVPPAWVVYLAGIHDIGKADPFFQNKEPVLAERLREAGIDVPKTVWPFRHEARSADWLREHLTRGCGWANDVTDLACQAVRGHHGDFQVDEPRLDEPCQLHPIWSELRNALAAAFADTLGVPSSPPAVPAHVSRAGAALAGLIVLSDWIASNPELFQYASLPRQVMTTQYLAAAQDEARRALAHLHFDGPPEPSAPRSFAAMWPKCRPLRPTQQALVALCERGVRPGLAIIEAPPGDGKTEGAVYLAERWRHATRRNGAYLALPTAATSNQMHGRYAGFLATERPGTAPVLVHGMAWLLDDASPTAISETYGDADEPDLARNWFRNMRRALLAPEGVGTVDQALLAALHVKHGVLRLLGLASKVLIIDEVHAYDEYMSTIMRRLLEWCRAMEVPVILLSATLSSRQKRELAEAYGGAGALPQMAELEPYPLLTFVPLQGDTLTVPVQDTRRREVRLQRHPGLLFDAPGTASLAAEQVQGGGCASVVVNTVADAQAVYSALKAACPANTELLLFHARFRAERRQEVEGLVVRRFGRDGAGRPARAILVATQVVEQSLDVDFDVMLSQLAPVDLLLQRAGRLHRHDRGPRPTGPEPVLHLLLPSDGCFDLGLTGRIYQHYPLLRTLALLHGRTALGLPADFRGLVEACYADGPIPKGVVPQQALTQAELDWGQARGEAEALARAHLIPVPSPREFRLALAPRRPVGEAEEGDAADYFHAQTRLGVPRTRALILHDKALAKLTHSDAAPSREALRRLMLQTADLPAWWLRGLKAADGLTDIREGPRWLRGWAIIEMPDADWRGVDKQGRAVTLRDDPELGLLREISNTKGEADADF